MIDLSPLTALIVMVGLLRIVHHAGRRVDTFLQQREQDAVDRMALIQQDRDIARRREEAAIEAVEAMPADIQMLINAESEKWAREEAEARAAQLYSKLQDWNKVRTVLAAELGR